MKFYRGSGSGARVYVESDHQSHRADDYYLAEGTGIAELIELTHDGTIADRMAMDGDTYEAWVEGVDVRTGELKGNVRGSSEGERGPLRFVEVIVNGPKSWSVAAGLHADISVAYERAQMQAVEEIGRYLAAHVGTRVGPRGAQVEMPAARIEMAAIRHYTSRAGDPHRHIHLQLNARLLAEDGKWRGLDSAAAIRMQRAINGVGHRAVISDPQFRAALAAHGYQLTDDGEIAELAEYVPAMSKRADQVARNIARYEAEWRSDNPGQEPDRDLLRSWDHRAWADGREAKKLSAKPGADAEHDWLRELQGLGLDLDADAGRQPLRENTPTVAQIDREAAAERVVAVLGAGARGRSTWNVYDVRGVAEEVITEGGIAAEMPAVRELVEDVADRALGRSLSVLERRGVPRHIRHLTSPAVIERVQDIEGRMATRAVAGHEDANLDVVERARGLTAKQLDRAQLAAVRAIAGSGALVVIEGAAGAGKTSVLSTAAQVVADRGARMVVVAPTRKAANVAEKEIAGSRTDTAAALARAYGYRWDDHGVWSRPYPADRPAGDGQLRQGDVLVVDEAGMLDQETARALLTVADECGASVVLMGDRRQLPAVGVGGVLDMAVRWAPVVRELDTVHRFRQAFTGERDEDFAALSLRIRSGVAAEDVFDELVDRGEVQLHDTEADALAAIAAAVAARYVAGASQTVAVSTNETAQLINEVVREQLVEAGAVDDTAVVHGSDGLPIGAGDFVMTRTNDYALGVANRETWTVQSIGRDGDVELASDARDAFGQRRTVRVPADYVRESVHLSYATTGHGVQGDTADAGAVFGDDTMDGAGLYVGLTRGRHSRVLHLVAGSVDEAREQYVEMSSRDRADLGLDAARAAASSEAERYAPARPSSAAERIAQLAQELRQDVPSPANRRGGRRASEPDPSNDRRHRPDGPRLR